MYEHLFEAEVLPPVYTFAYAPLSNSIYAPTASDSQRNEILEFLEQENSPWLISDTSCDYSPPEKPIITFFSSISDLQEFQQARPEIYIDLESSEHPLKLRDGKHLELFTKSHQWFCIHPYTRADLPLPSTLVKNLHNLAHLFDSFDIYSDTSPVDYLGEVNLSRTSSSPERTKAEEFLKLYNSTRAQLLRTLLPYFKIPPQKTDVSRETSDI